MEDIVIVAATRTAVGKFGGSLAGIAATELGSIVIKEALARAKLSPDQVGEVIMGQVLAAGAGQNPARQALLKSGIDKSVPALTINAVCGSGLKAVMLAAQSVAYGDSEIVIAGGQENMSLAPHVLPNSRNGQRMGDWKLQDTMIVDGLWDVYNQYHMGITAFRPEPHTALMVSAGVSLAPPLLSHAWRAGFCPAPAASTWPMMASPTWSGETLARASASLITMAPSSVAARPASEPPNLPTAVRVAETMTMSSMGSSPVVCCRSVKGM